MALSTYAGLKASVAAWRHRADLTSSIPDFIKLAEGDIRSKVRCSAMQTLDTGTLTGETLAFPTGFLEGHRLTINGDLHEYVTPELYAVMSDASSEEYVYSIIGQSIYILNGASGDDYTLLYYAAFANLADDADTNWLLTNHPAIYLYGSLKHVATYLMDDKALDRFAALMEANIGRLNTSERQARYSGRLQVRQSPYIATP